MHRPNTIIVHHSITGEQLREYLAKEPAYRISKLIHWKKRALGMMDAVEKYARKLGNCKLHEPELDTSSK